MIKMLICRFRGGNPGAKPGGLKAGRLFLLAGLLVVLGAGGAPAARAARPETGAYEINLATEKHVLDNGLTVLLTDMPQSESVSLYAMVKTGSATEGSFVGAGLTHFIEHMLFKGTEKRTAGEISTAIQGVGGTINAMTSSDYTVYTLTVPVSGFDTALDVLSDMLINAQFDPQELEREREVVIKEMRMRNDWPDYYLRNKVFESVYTTHPYRFPVIGYESLLRQVTRDDLVGYFKRYYPPNNIIFSVAGRLEEGGVLDKIEQTFAGWPRGPYQVRSLPDEPPQLLPRRVELEYSTPLTRVSCVYRGVRFMDKDMPALDVLAMVLGQGETSRLYKTLFTEQHLVRGISCANYTPMDRGGFEINAELDYPGVEPALKAVRGEIDKIAQRGITPAELEKTKRQVLSQYIGGLQSSGPVAFQTALDEYFADNYAFSKSYVAMVRALSVEDIKRVAVEYLRPEDLTVVILKPRAEATATAVEKAPAQEALIQKMVLPNGLTVLVRENHTLPLVTLMAALQGGTRAEPEGLTGLSQLTAQLWVKGTRSRSSDQIAMDVESRGGSLGGFSGRNSFGLSMNLLSGDTDFGIKLLHELVTAPSFSAEALPEEREKLMTAILARDDRIANLTMQALEEDLFVTPGFRNDTLGTASSVNKITHKDITDFYKTFFASGNMVVSVFGDVDAPSVFATMRKLFGGLPARPAPELRLTEPPLAGPKERTIRVDKQQAMVMVGFKGADIFSEDRAGVNVLTAVLGSSFSGRIFTQIREQLGQAYTLGGNYVPGLDTGLVYFAAQTTVDQVEAVKSKLVQIIDEVRREKVPEEELRETKAYLKGTFHMGMETDGAVAFMTTLDELYGLGFDYYQGYDAAVDGVSPDDLLRLARKYLDPSRAVIVTALPREAEEPVAGIEYNGMARAKRNDQSDTAR